MPDSIGCVRLVGPAVNTPPQGASVGEAIFVGSSPTAGTAFVNHAGELAWPDGVGGWRFESKAACKGRSFTLAGVVYAHDGSTLLALAGSAAVATALDNVLAASFPADNVTAAAADTGIATINGDSEIGAVEPPAADSADYVLVANRNNGTGVTAYTWVLRSAI